MAGRRLVFVCTGRLSIREYLRGIGQWICIEKEKRERKREKREKREKDKEGKIMKIRAYDKKK